MGQWSPFPVGTGEELGGKTETEEGVLVGLYVIHLMDHQSWSIS